MITEYYTGTGQRPVNSIAEASVTGHGTNVIQGLAVSLESTALPALVIIAGIIVTYNLAGLFGIAIAVTTMLALAGMVVALDAFGPVTDNAGGIAEMAGLPTRKCATTPTRSTRSATPPRPSPRATPSVRPASARWCCSPPIRRTCSSSPPTPAEGSFFYGLGAVNFSLANPYVVVGLLFGGLLPFLFGGMSMTAVGRAAQSVVVEVRRQFKEKPGIMAGTEKPDYGRAVDMLTKAAIREMIVPSLLPVLSPIVVFFVDLLDRRPGRGLRRARRHADGRHRHRPLRRHLDDRRRRRLGQRQEELRGRLHRQPRRQSTSRAPTPTRPPSPATPSATPTRTPPARR